MAEGVPRGPLLDVWARFEPAGQRSGRRELNDRPQVVEDARRGGTHEVVVLRAR